MSRLREAMDVVRANPKSATAWITLGQLLAAEGQNEKATQSFQRALQLEPTNPAAQQGLAQLLLASSGGASEARTTPPVSQALPAATRAEAPADAQPATISRADMKARSGGARPYEAAIPELRTPPPPPRKPSQERVILGFIVALAVPLLCLCALVFALARVI